MSIRCLILTPLFIAFLISCGAKNKTPNLNWIYQDEIANVRKRPVIVIPGVLGSGLRDAASHETFWLDASFLWSERKRNSLSLPHDRKSIEEITDELESFQMIEKIKLGTFEVDVYWGILNVLGVGGFRDAALENVEPDPNHSCYVYHYDWRNDLVKAAQGLAQLIEEAQRVLGNKDLKVNIVAHSMGGLVARYYLMYGAQPLLENGKLPELNWAGAKNVNHLIMIGTPNHGSVISFKALHQGFSLGPLGLLDQAQVSTMPSLYQLMPHSGVQTLYSEQLKPIPEDLYEVSTWEKYGLGIFNSKVKKELRQEFTSYQQNVARLLKRAKRFHQALNAKSITNSPTKMLTFGGDCDGTLEAAIVNRESPTEVYFDSSGNLPNKRAQADLLYAPGDSRVTRASLLLKNKTVSPQPINLDYVSFNCTPHHKLTEDPVFQDNLLRILFEDPLTEATSVRRDLLSP